jgi:hypothetical protein
LFDLTMQVDRHEAPASASVVDGSIHDQEMAQKASALSPLS